MLCTTRIDEATLKQLRTGIDPLTLRRADPVVSRLVSLSPDGVLTFYSSSITVWPGKREAYVEHVQMVDWEDALAYDGTFMDRANLALFGDLKVSCSCLSGDTRVPLLDGRVLTMEELLREYGTEELFWVYSVDDRGDFIPALAKCAGVTGLVTEMLRVTLDDGSHVDCTPDHLFMLRSGEYVRADSLEAGTSLMPLYRDSDFHGYERVQLNSEPGKWLHTHRVVAAAVRGDEMDEAAERTEQYLVVHHDNFDKRCNAPDNLRWMGVIEHWLMHSHLAGWRHSHAKMRRDLADPEKRPAVVARLARAGSISLKKHPEKITEFYEAGIAWCRSHRDELSKRMTELWADPAKREAMIEHLIETLASPETRELKSRIAKELWLDPEIRAKRAAGLRAHFASDGAREAARDRQLEAWDDPELVARHSAKMREVSNRPDVKEKKARKVRERWSDPEYKEAMREKLRAAWNKRREAVLTNHSVVSVETLRFDEPVPVYDLTVDGQHNFLVGAGVIVHNCGAFLYQGFKYMLSQLDANYSPAEDWEGHAGDEDRFPQVRNPNLRGIVCKHLSSVLYVTSMSVSKVASLMKEMVRTGDVELPEEEEPKAEPEPEPKSEPEPEADGGDEDEEEEPE